MAEAKPKKVIKGGLSPKVQDKDLETLFMGYLQIEDMIWRNDPETSKLRRGHRAITARKKAAEVGNASGKPSHEKDELPTTPPVGTGRLSPPPSPPRSTGPPRRGRGGRGGRGGGRRLPRRGADGSSSVKS